MRICRFFFRGFLKFKFCKNFFYFLYIHLPLLGSFEVTQNKLGPIDSSVKFRFSPPQLGYMIPLFQFSRAVFQLKCFCFEIRLSCFVVYLSIYLSIYLVSVGIIRRTNNSSEPEFIGVCQLDSHLVPNFTVRCLCQF